MGNSQKSDENHLIWLSNPAMHTTVLGGGWLVAILSFWLYAK